MALVQKVTGSDLQGVAFPLRVVRSHQDGDAGDVLEQIELDDDTNAELIRDIEANQRLYGLSGGVLTKRGQTVQTSQDPKRAAVRKLLSTGGLSSAEVEEVLRLLLEELRS